MWTQHMKKLQSGRSIPWTSYQANEANAEAVKISNEDYYCVQVVPVKLPREVNTFIYVLLANQDETYRKPSP